ncbi:MAG: IscS subfamily cysteine desulfurase [Proteobacteria bacterium]|nr:IscS subfamily cysteine desulfurase [Pseudomonadota bacterium]
MSEHGAAAAQGTARPIYLDYQATTPCDPRVVEAMLPFFTERFGNPHSVHPDYGGQAEAAVETARAQVAALIGAEPREIVFTSGATEANNLAIKGVARFHRERRGHLVSCTTEHKCVIEAVRRLEREGTRVTRLAVGADGLIDLAELEAAVTEETALVTIMAVNNEIGVIQPLAEIGALCRARGALFHSDGAQAVGKIPLDVAAMKIDLLSISGHKVYGPMGVGALYVRRRPRVRLEPLFDGGGQERGLRSGTLPLPLCVGLGATCAIAKAEMAEESERLGRLQRRLHEGITARLSGVQVNGDPERRIPGNLNLSFAGVDGEALIAAMPGIAVSTGSACTSASVEPSYVLRALGIGDDLAGASIRIGFGRFTTEAEIDTAIETIAAAVTRLRGTGARAAE